MTRLSSAARGTRSSEKGRPTPPRQLPRHLYGRDVPATAPDDLARRTVMLGILSFRHTSTSLSSASGLGTFCHCVQPNRLASSTLESNGGRQTSTGLDGTRRVPLGSAGSGSSRQLVPVSGCVRNIVSSTKVRRHSRPTQTKRIKIPAKTNIQWRSLVRDVKIANIVYYGQNKIKQEVNPNLHFRNSEKKKKVDQRQLLS